MRRAKVQIRARASRYDGWTITLLNFFSTLSLSQLPVSLLFLKHIVSVGCAVSETIDISSNPQFSKNLTLVSESKRSFNEFIR